MRQQYDRIDNLSVITVLTYAANKRAVNLESVDVQSIESTE